MIDIHCHLLPGLDDGPADIDEAVALAKKLHSCGVHTVVATPHFRTGAWRPPIEDIDAAIACLKARLTEEGVDIEVIPGAEVGLVDAVELSKEELVALSFGKQGRYVLLEAPTLMPVEGIEQGIFRAQLSGPRAILAHPERLHAYQMKPERLASIFSSGVLVQLDARSLLGKEGREAKRAGQVMLRNGHVHFVGSDAHSCGRRYVDFQELAAYLTSLCGEAGA